MATNGDVPLLLSGMGKDIAFSLKGHLVFRRRIHEAMLSAYLPEGIQAKSEALIEGFTYKQIRYWENAFAEIEIEIEQLKVDVRKLAQKLKGLTEDCKFQDEEEGSLPQECTEGCLTLQLNNLQSYYNKLSLLKQLQSDGRQRLPGYSPTKGERVTWRSVDQKIKSLESRLDAAAFTSATPASQPRQVDAVEEPSQTEQVLRFLDSVEPRRPAFRKDQDALPFIERTSNILDVLFKMALSYKSMRDGTEHAKEAAPGLAYLEGPTGSGKTRFLKELSSCMRTVDPARLVEELLARDKRSQNKVGEETVREFVKLWQSDRNVLVIYMDFMEAGLWVGPDECVVGVGTASFSEALRILCAYAGIPREAVERALGPIAKKLQLGAVMAAIKQHHQFLSGADPKELLLCLLMKDEGQKMVRNADQPGIGRDYGQTMILATQAYRCVTESNQDSLARTQGVCLYTIVAGTLLRELMPSQDSQYVSEQMDLTPIPAQRARHMLRDYVKKVGGEAPTAEQTTLRTDADFIFEQPRMKAMIEDTAGIFRLLRFLVNAIIFENDDMIESRRAGNWTIWFALVACNFLKLLKGHFGVTSISSLSLGEDTVVRNLLDLIVSGYEVKESDNVGRIDSAGGLAGDRVSILDAMRSGILYYQRTSEKLFKLIAPSAQLCSLVAEARYPLPRTAYEFPASGPVDPFDFEVVVAQRESAAARVVSRYGKGIQDLESAFGRSAIVSPGLKGLRTKILHPDAPVLRERSSFLSPPRAATHNSPAILPVAAVEMLVTLQNGEIVDIRKGQCVLLCDGATSAPNPYFDVRLVRGDADSKELILEGVSVKRLTTGRAMTLDQVRSWYDGARAQMALYERQFRVIYVIVAACPVEESVKGFVASTSNIVIVDKAGLAAYLPIVGIRSILLSYDQV